MKFINTALPKPSEGISFIGIKDEVVPDQSMSLQEILERFTRGEAIPVGMQTETGDEDLDNPLNVDLEKMKFADLTDKAEYSEKLEEVKRSYDKQEKKKAAKIAAETAAAQKAAEEKKIQDEVENRLKNKSA